MEDVTSSDDYADDDLHPIPKINVIDRITTAQYGQKCYGIRIATPIAADVRSQKRLIKKIELYLWHIVALGAPVERDVPAVHLKNILLVSVHPDSESAIFKLLEGCRQWLMENGVAFCVNTEMGPECGAWPSSDIAWRVTFDALTGLMNPRAFEQYLEVLLRSNGDDAVIIVSIIRLEGFHALRDAGGGREADAYFRQIAKCLSQRANEVSGAVARVGGEEFAVALETASVEQGCAVIRRLLRAISEYRFNLKDQAYSHGESAGVSSTMSGRDVVGLVKSADIACEESSTACRGTALLYQPDLVECDSESRRRLREVLSIYHERRFKLSATAIPSETPPFRACLDVKAMPTGTGAVDGACAVEIADRFQLLASSDRWLVRETLKRMSAGDAPFESDTCVLFDLSSQTLVENDFARFVGELLTETAIEPSRCHFKERCRSTGAVNRDVRDTLDALVRGGCQVWPPHSSDRPDASFPFLALRRTDAANDTRPIADEMRIEMALRFPYKAMTAQQYAARWAHTIYCSSFDEYRYPDPALTQWIDDLHRILRTPEEVERCRQEHLSPTEQLAVMREIAEERENGI